MGRYGNGSISATELQTRALAGIREQLLTPALIKRFAALLQQEHGRSAGWKRRARHGRAQTGEDLRPYRQPRHSD
jgi:hypothetical protein